MLRLLGGTFYLLLLASCFYSLLLGGSFKLLTSSGRSYLRFLFEPAVVLLCPRDCAYGYFTKQLADGVAKTYNIKKPKNIAQAPTIIQ